MKNTILIIEDDKELAKYIQTILIESGRKSAISHSGMDALKTLKNGFEPDLVLLDLILPDIQGEDLAIQIRDLLPSTQVVMLTSKAGPENIVKGFQLGAADYIIKPFNREELLARLDARLNNNSSNIIVSIPSLTIDKEKVEVKVNNKVIALTKLEYNLLLHLSDNQDKVLSRESILNKVWDFPLDVESRVVDVYIGYLRKKLKKAGAKVSIKSVRGFGYKITKS